MKVVAAQAGVTVGTVSAILRGSRDRISYRDETRARVLAVVAQLGYRVNSTARSLREGKTRMVGVMLDDITLPFLASLICAAGKTLETHGHSIMLCSLAAAHAARDSLLQVFAHGHIDSFLLAGALTRLADQDIVAIHQHGHRLVLIERESPAPGIAAVGVDNRAGGRLAAGHLLARGCRRLLVLGGPEDNPMAHRRIEGALAAWGQAGMAATDVAVLAAGGWTAELGYAALSRQLAHRPRPDAVFACNDLLALGALRALAAHGLAVPAAVAVIGFDDGALAAFAGPPLTTVRQPAEQMGQAAAELVLRPAPELAARPQLFVPELIVRQSA